MADTEDQDAKPLADAVAEVTVETPAPQADPMPPAAPAPRRRSGFGGLVLGGVLAAGLGFGLAHYVPTGWPLGATSDLQAMVEAQAKDIATLKDQLAAANASLAALESTPPTEIEPVSAALAALTERVLALESLPADGSPAGLAGLTESVRRLQAELEAVKASGPVSGNATALAAEAEARLKEAEAQAAALKAEAEALATAAAQRAALGRLQAALDSGQPFGAALPDLGQEVPPALSALAETGLPTLARLQQEFAPAARNALNAALRADMGESWTERVGSFLRSQTGARSLTPREGDDPDAVLSRAEAALAAGDLAATFKELDALPEVAKPALADWRAVAEQRLAAETAIQAIAAKIGG